MYTYVYTQLHTYTYLHIYVCMYVYICMHTDIYIHVHIFKKYVHISTFHCVRDAREHGVHASWCHQQHTCLKDNKYVKRDFIKKKKTFKGDALAIQTCICQSRARTHVKTPHAYNCLRLAECATRKVIHICIYIHTYMHLYERINIYTHKYIYIYKYMYLYIYV